ncbi:MAG: VOC family protein [Thermomicrobiales bacterium]
MLRGLTTVAYAAFDHEGAKRWYADLLGVEPYFDRPEYVEFRIGDYQHELGIINTARFGALGAEAPESSAPGGAIVYWHVDDVPVTLARLEAMGATIHHPPRDFGEGFIGAAVVDPFGNILGIMHNPHYLDVLAGIGEV